MKKEPQKVVAMNDRPTLEVLPPAAKPQTIADYYSHSISQGGGRGRGNRKYKNKEELIAAIQSYFQSIVNEDGTYNRPPTWGGVGIHLGFSSKSWDENYRDADEFREVIAHAMQLIDVWRKEQMVVPGKGIYPAGLMFQQTRDEEQAARYAGMKDITPTGEEKRPTEAATLIDDVWRKKGE